MTDASTTKPVADDRWIRKFLTHLATDRDASVYTQRNYRQALLEFFYWHREEPQQPSALKTRWKLTPVSKPKRRRHGAAKAQSELVFQGPKV